MMQFTVVELQQRGLSTDWTYSRWIATWNVRSALPPVVQTAVTTAVRDEIAGWISEALESLGIALGRMKSLIESFREEVEQIGNFPSLFLGTVSEDGALEYYDGRIRMVDSEGDTVADGLAPLRYHTDLGEASEEWSFMKFPFYKPLGYPRRQVSCRASGAAERRHVRWHSACGS